MATIKRIELSPEELGRARSEVFTASYGFSDGQILPFEMAKLFYHEVDGVAKKEKSQGVLVLRGFSDVIYLKSLLKDRVDYQNKIQPITGTLNLKIATLQGKPWGEIVDLLNKEFVGKSFRAVRKTYLSVDRNGDVAPRSYNEFDIL